MAIDKQYWSAAQILDRVKDELDLVEESFIDNPEMLRYANAAIDRAEQSVIGIHKDYFLSSAPLRSDGNPDGLLNGVREYLLPIDIYAHKIRRIIFESGSRVYKVGRIQDWRKFEKMAIENINNSATLYEYFLVNRTPGAPVINIVPVPRETGDYVTVWYCRQANRFNTNDVNDVENILDIPEAFNYVVEFVKMKCDIKEKRRQGQMEQGEYPEVALEMREMLGAIQEIVPDAENLIEPDFSAYEEHS